MGTNDPRDRSQASARPSCSPAGSPTGIKSPFSKHSLELALAGIRRRVVQSNAIEKEDLILVVSIPILGVVGFGLEHHRVAGQVTHQSIGGSNRLFLDCLDLHHKSPDFSERQYKSRI